MPRYLPYDSTSDAALLAFLQLCAGGTKEEALRFSYPVQVAGKDVHFTLPEGYAQSTATAAQIIRRMYKRFQPDVELWVYTRPYTEFGRSRINGDDRIQEYLAITHIPPLPAVHLPGDEPAGSLADELFPEGLLEPNPPKGKLFVPECTAEEFIDLRKAFDAPRKLRGCSLSALEKQLSHFRLRGSKVDALARAAVGANYTLWLSAVDSEESTPSRREIMLNADLFMLKDGILFMPCFFRFYRHSDDVHAILDDAKDFIAQNL